MVASIWEGSQVIPSTANADNSYLTEEFTALADGDNVFTLTSFIYQPDTGSIDVYIFGVHQRALTDFEETSNNSVTVFDLKEGDAVTIKGLIGGDGTQSAVAAAEAAEASAAAAVVSEANAATSATAAASSATDSASSASDSAASAVDSANSATDSANSASDAATSATQAANTANTINGGATALRYTFSTTTTDSDPGAGFLRLDNATQNLSTTIRVDLTDANGQDLTSLLNTLDDSTSTLSKGQFKLVHRDNVTKWITFNLTSLASPAGYKNYTVSVSASSAANPFADTDPVILIWERTGDKGDTGTATITIVQRSSNTQILVSDNAKLFELTSSFTQTFDTPANLGNGWWCEIQNAGTGEITIPSSDGFTNWKMYPKERRRFMTDGVTITTKLCQAFAMDITTTTVFTKPPGYSYFEGEMWNGGNSGVKGQIGGLFPAAAGGGAFPFQLPASLFGTTETITIGAGGAAVTTANTIGNVGGVTSIGSILTLTASADYRIGSSITITAAASNAVGFEGGTNNVNGANTIWGGSSGSNDGTVASKNSIYGGAAGGSIGADTVTLRAPGTSKIGGNGGAAVAAGNGIAGTAPGGAGGATNSGAQSGAGARGEVRIRGRI